MFEETVGQDEEKTKRTINLDVFPGNVWYALLTLGMNKRPLFMELKEQGCPIEYFL